MRPKLAKTANAVFEKGAIDLLSRALADGLSLDITVEPGDARAVLADTDGTTLARLERGGVQLALPLPAPRVEVPAPAPCVCTWERDAAGFRCVWCDRVAWGEEHEALTRRFARPVEAPAIDPIAPGHRVMRAGDLVVERIAGGATRDWIVREVNPKGPTLQRDDRPDLFETVTWGHITLDAADLWRLSSPHDPAEAEPSRGDGRPVEGASHHGVSVGDRLILDGVAVEVVGVDSGGFFWRTVDVSDDPCEGETLWPEVRHVAANVWAPRVINAPDPIEEPPVEAAPPEKKTRTKKARAPKVAASTEPAAPVPHRLQAVTEADELAHHGAHSLIGLIGREWRTLATRESGETAPTWQARCTLASKTVRVRVYDRATRCTWDSLDGNAEGYIHGGPA